MISISSNSMKQTLHQYLMQYKSIFNKRSFDIFYWLIMGILCTEEVRSIQFVYDSFIKKHTDKVLNSIYYFLSYSKFPIEELTTTTVSIALSLIPEELRGNTLFDDTLQSKYGNKFDCYAKHFDHTRKTGSQYLKGHCFVSVVLNIPLYYQFISRTYLRYCNYVSIIKAIAMQSSFKATVFTAILNWENIIFT